MIIHSLRSETDDLQSQIKSLEALEDDTQNLKNMLDSKLTEMNNHLKELQALKHTFENSDTRLENHFTEARSDIYTIFEKLHNIRPHEEVEE